MTAKSNHSININHNSNKPSNLLIVFIGNSGRELEPVKGDFSTAAAILFKFR